MTATATAPAAPAVTAPAAPVAPAPINNTAPASTAPAAAPAPKASTTALETGENTAPDPVAPSDWPADWREKASVGADGKVDEKLLGRFKRYNSPKAALEALRHAQDRIAKGELQKVLGDNPTPEEIAEYRAANGIPEKPDGYKLELGDGRVVGEAEKPLVNKFLESMHANHASPAMVSASLNAYFALRDEQMRQREDTDLSQKNETVEMLRQEFGPEYRGNMNAIHGLLGTLPGGVGTKLLNARFSDGTAAGNDPDFIRALVNIARELNPAASVAPGSPGTAQNTVADEITKFKTLMADPNSEYHKGPKAEANQKRYRELLKANESLTARKAA